MAKFLFIYRGDPSGSASLTPDQMQKQMQQWSSWIADALQKGWMIDPGDGLTEEGRVVTGKVVTDGPFVESKEIIGGYSIVTAANIDAATALAKGCPSLHGGGRVEVRALAGFADMMKPQ
jgi:hypothetical protein